MPIRSLQATGLRFKRLIESRRHATIVRACWVPSLKLLSVVHVALLCMNVEHLWHGVEKGVE